MNALVTIDTLTPEVVFAPGGVEAIISKLEADVRSVKTDMSTDEGRKEIASLAYKVARSKTALDEMGKELVAGIKAQASKIDAERRIIRDRLDALKEEVRKPLTDWEDAEKARVAEHEQAIATIINMAQIEHGTSSDEIAQLIEGINFFSERNWQEFAARAAGTIEEVSARLNKAMAAAQKREAEAAELERFRAEQAARAQAEREARIAEEAVAKARAEMEAKAKREAEEAALAAEREHNRVERERAEAIARAERAEREAKEAAERAERDRLTAIEAERKRAADAAAKEAAEAAKREANKRHLAKVNNAAVAAFVAGGMAEDAAKLAVTLIAKRQIPAITIAY